MPNAADEKSIETRDKQLKLERQKELNDIREVVKTPAGIRFFRRLMNRGYIFHTTFTGNSQGMFLEGRRDFALSILHDVCEAAPEKVADLMKVLTEEKED